MKNVKMILAVVLLLAIGLSLVACGKANIQTESAAIAHLKKQVKEKDIADELLYYYQEGSCSFASSSYATLSGDTWTVVLHGHITGYTDYNKTNYSTIDFSYVAEVKTDGTVRKLFVQQGKVTNVYYE